MSLSDDNKHAQLTTTISAATDETVENDAAEVVEVQNPLVFQCANCKVIVGDSFAWFSADQVLNVITLTNKTVHVLVEQDLQFSNDGSDCGRYRLPDMAMEYLLCAHVLSAYLNLKCSSCALILGKSYKSTPRQWDMIRDMFSFDLNSISSYQLGVDCPVGDSNLDEQVSMPSAVELRTSLAKLQTGLLHLNDRIDRISLQLAETRSKQSSSSLKRPRTLDTQNENIRLNSNSSNNGTPKRL